MARKTCLTFNIKLDLISSPLPSVWLDSNETSHARVRTTDSYLKGSFKLLELPQAKIKLTHFKNPLLDLISASHCSMWTNHNVPLTMNDWIRYVLILYRPHPKDVSVCQSTTGGGGGTPSAGWGTPFPGLDGGYPVQLMVVMVFIPKIEQIILLPMGVSPHETSTACTCYGRSTTGGYIFTGVC